MLRRSKSWQSPTQLFLESARGAQRCSKWLHKNAVKEKECCQQNTIVANIEGLVYPQSNTLMACTAKEGHKALISASLPCKTTWSGMASNNVCALIRCRLEYCSSMRSAGDTSYCYKRRKKSKSLRAESLCIWRDDGGVNAPWPASPAATNHQHQVAIGLEQVGRHAE